MSRRLQDSEQAVEWAAVNFYKPGEPASGCCSHYCKPTPLYSLWCLVLMVEAEVETEGGCPSAGDEFHLVHIVKDETEKLREYYQEKSLGAPHACLQCSSLPTRIWMRSGLLQLKSIPQPTMTRPNPSFIFALLQPCRVKAVRKSPIQCMRWCMTLCRCIAGGLPCSPLSEALHLCTTCPCLTAWCSTGPAP